MEEKWFERRGIFFLLGIVQIFLLTLFLLLFAEYGDRKHSEVIPEKGGRSSVENK